MFSDIGISDHTATEMELALLNTWFSIQNNMRLVQFSKVVLSGELGTDVGFTVVMAQSFCAELDEVASGDTLFLAMVRAAQRILGRLNEHFNPTGLARKSLCTTIRTRIVRHQLGVSLCLS